VTVANDWEQLGRTAYEAYAEAVGGVTVAGQEMWSWADMRQGRPDVADAWVASARAVAFEVEV
jgi:hypothetical protein